MFKNNNFDMDDPLGDLLSDNSLDSFLDGQSNKKYQSGDTINSAKKKTDLFGLTDEDTIIKPDDVIPDKKSSQHDWLGIDNIKDSIKNQVLIKDSQKTDVLQDTFSTKPSAKSSTIFDDFTSGYGKSKPSSPHHQSFLDDILGPSSLNKEISKVPIGHEHQKTSTETNRPKISIESKILNTSADLKRPKTPTGNKLPVTSMNIKRPKTPIHASDSKIIDPLEILGKEQGKKTVSSKENSKPVAYQPRKLQGSSDWLGVFADVKSDNIFESAESNANIDDGDGLPSWLSKTGNVPKDKQLIKSKSENLTDKQLKTKTPSEHQIVDAKHFKSESATAVPRSEPADKETRVSYVNPDFPSALGMSHPDAYTSSQNIFGCNMDQSAAICMQQQESQLMLALQLKAQEDRLSHIRSRQEETQKIHREISNVHQSQLNSLLNQQVKYQRQMHRVIGQHQDNINEQIKNLLGHDLKTEDGITVGVEKHAGDSDAREQVHFIQKPSVEQNLEQFVRYLQDNHEKEIELLESSYRRQMCLVDDSLKQMGERQKIETEKVTTYYNEQLLHMEELYKANATDFEKKLNDMKAQHASDIVMLHKQYEVNLTILQKQHVDVVEKIKETINHERGIIQDSKVFSQSLDEILITLKTHCKVSSKLVEKLDETHNRVITQKEGSLRIREEQVGEMLVSLDRQREVYECELKESKVTHKVLNESLQQQLQACAEQTRALKEKQMEIQFAKDHHKKYVTLTNEQLQEENDKLQKLKQKLEEEKSMIEDEVREKRLQLKNEEIIIKRDKTSLNEHQKTNEDAAMRLGNMKEELEEKAQLIRSERLKLQNELDDISARGRDLENLTKAALVKQAEAEQKISEAELVHRKYEERIKRLQEQAIALNERENQMSREKVGMSRERLMLHNLKRDLESKQCGLCRVQSESIGTVDNYYSYKMPHLDVSKDSRVIPGVKSLERVTNDNKHEREHYLMALTKARSLNRQESPEVIYKNPGINIHTHENITTYKEIIDSRLAVLKMDMNQASFGSISIEENNIEG